MTPEETEIRHRLAFAQAHAVPAARLIEHYVDDVDALLRRANRAEDALDDWARSVMAATAGVVCTPEEGFAKAPYTLHQAVMGLRNACKTAQGEHDAALARLAAAEAREKVLREACRPVAEWLAASLALREAECEEDCPDRRILAAVDKYAVTAGDARAIALALTASPATALEAAIEQARAEERSACVAACLNEQVDAAPGSESDEAYNRACEDCANAIRERGKG